MRMFKLNGLVVLCLACVHMMASPAVQAEANAFTVVVLPDTQYYTTSDKQNAHFERQTQWVVDNLESPWLQEHLGSRRIAFVTHLGDVVQNGAVGPDRNFAEWQRAQRAMSILDGDLAMNPDGRVPYSVTLGNHDTDAIHRVGQSVERFVEYFGPDRYAGRSWYGGHRAGRSHFQTFEAGGHRFLHLNLQWQMTDDDIAWAHEVMADHPNHAVMVTTHAYLYNGEPFPDRNKLDPAGNNGQQMFEKLIAPSDRIFLVLNGHFPEPESMRIAENAGGWPVFEMESNYQDRKEGGQGWLRLLTFDMDNGLLHVRTYSPVLDRFETDANSEFTLDLDMTFFENVTRIPEPAGLSLLLPLGLLLGRRPRERAR